MRAAESHARHRRTCRRCEREFAGTRRVGHGQNPGAHTLDTGEASRVDTLLGNRRRRWFGPAQARSRAAAGGPMCRSRSRRTRRRLHLSSDYADEFMKRLEHGKSSVGHGMRTSAFTYPGTATATSFSMTLPPSPTARSAGFYPTNANTAAMAQGTAHQDEICAVEGPHTASPGLSTVSSSPRRVRRPRISLLNPRRDGPPVCRPVLGRKIGCSCSGPRRIDVSCRPCVLSSKTLPQRKTQRDRSGIGKSVVLRCCCKASRLVRLA